MKRGTTNPPHTSGHCRPVRQGPSVWRDCNEATSGFSRPSFPIYLVVNLSEMTLEQLHNWQTNYLIAVGRKEGTADVVVDLLDQRFGRLPEFVKQRVQELCTLDLRDIARRLLTAKNLYEALDIEPLRPRSKDSESEG